MAARVWPVDAVAGAPSYTGRALRQTTVAPFVAMGSTGRPLGAKSGIRVGTPSSIVSATSTTWTVQPFVGVIDGESAAIAGPYAYSFDTNQTGAVTAAAASARIDRLDVQISDPAESDGSSTPGVAVVYTAGTAGSGVPPTAAPRSHALAFINVPATGGGSPTTSWAPAWTGDTGAWLFNTLAERDAYVTAITSANVPVAQVAQVIGGATYTWSGSAWIGSGLRVALIKDIAQNSVASSQSKITWSTSAASVDIGGFYSTANNTRLTAPAAGVYRINVTAAAQDSTASRKIGILKNGTFSTYIGSQLNGSAFAMVPVGHTVVALSAGDYVEISVVDSTSLNIVVTQTTVVMELIA